MIKKNEELAIIKNIILNLLCKKSTVFNWKVSLLLFVLNDKKQNDISSNSLVTTPKRINTGTNVFINDKRQGSNYINK